MLLAASTLLLGRSLQAQSFPVSSHNIWNPQTDQPAFTGISKGIRLVGGYRYQWTGIEGAPMTAYAGADMPLPIKNSSGGVWLNYDRTGAMSFTQARIAYAYKIPVAKNFISAGIHAGIVSIGLDGSKLTTPGGQGGNNDDLLPGAKNSGIRPEIGAGLVFHHDKFYAGVFINNAAGLSSRVDGLTSSFNADYGRYVGFQGGASIRLSENVSFNPMLLYRTDFTNHQIELVALTSLKERFSLGAGFRGYNNNSIESLLALMKIGITKDLEIRYSYDVNLLALNAVSRGSHEFSIGYIIPKEAPSRKGKIINHPRYL